MICRPTAIGFGSAGITSLFGSVKAVPRFSLGIIGLTSSSNDDVVGAEFMVIEEESDLSGNFALEAHSVRFSGLDPGVRNEGDFEDIAADPKVSMYSKW
jgi:hypothetical protein